MTNKPPVSRGFRARKRPEGRGARVPPGQSVVSDFPVLSAGPTPRTTLDTWTFALQEGGSLLAKWTWAEFGKLPRTTVVVDIHCVTTWSKLDTEWQGVSIDTLLTAAAFASRIAVLPLLKKNSRIVETAHKLCADLRRRWHSVYDDTASIGRLYRRQDEVGTPFCVTVDVQTVGDSEKGEQGDGRVTIRDRDSMEQIRVPIPELGAVLRELLGGALWSQVSARFGATPAAGSA